MNKAIHLLAVVTCLSHAGWGRAAEPTSANFPTPAASPSPRLPAKDKVVVYSGAAIIDGTGGPLRPEMAIITRGERIEAIVPQAELKLPPGAEVVDVQGLYALPGLIDFHEHPGTPSQFLLCGFASLRDKACGSHAKAQRRKGC